jgi:Tfp pilus assembly protein PilO
MPSTNINTSYKLEHARYRHYFHRLWIYYQKPATKVSTALLLTVFTTIFFAVFAIRPTLVTVAELLRKIEDQQLTLDKMKQKAGALATAQSEYLTYQSEIALLDIAIPQDYEIEALSNYLEGAAANRQIALNTITLGPVEYQQEDAPKLNELQELTISLALDTDYSSIKNLLQDLSSLPRYLSIDSVGFGGSTNESGQTSTSTIKMTISGRAYYLPRSKTPPATTQVEPENALNDTVEDPEF